MKTSSGGQLVHRDGKDTRLTELGRTLRGAFEAIVAGEMQARELAAMVTAEGRTMLTIGVAEGLGPPVIWRFLAEFLAEMEKVELVLRAVESERSAELVLMGVLDACFCTTVGRTSPKVQALTLYEERLRVAVSRGHRLATLPEIAPDALRAVDNQRSSLLTAAR